MMDMRKRRILISIGIFVVAVAIATVGGSFYMLDYSLGYEHKPGDLRGDTESAYAELYRRVPDMKPWCDSLLQRGLIRDTFVMMPTGERHHAIYLRNDSAKGRTAVVVHGYTDNCVKFMYLGRMYHRDLGYNILMPALHAHGKSEGEEIQLGLKAQFSLPPFTLLYTASALCKLKYGWSFGEASPLRQVAKCHRPMLFIHGDADTYVPFAMMQPLYDAKPQPKQMWVAKGSKHADAYLDHREEYTATVREFLGD